MPIFPKNCTKTKGNLISRCTLLNCLRGFLIIFTIITVVVGFVPLNPRLPSTGLDPSWQFSMNEAVAQNLRIGQDIIFTFGPYASMFTRMYHPATDHLMLFGSVFFGVCYSLCLLYLAKGSKLLCLVVFVLLFSNYKADALFLSYPLLLAVCIFKYIAEGSHKNINDMKLKYLQLLLLAFLFVPLGLLPLIKGSFLLISAMILIVVFFYLLYSDFREFALIVLMIPVLSNVLFWYASGQAIFNLPNFFYSMVPIIAGYTEAMALSGRAIDLLVYVIAASIIMYTIIKMDKINSREKIFLGICFALFLAISFKAGFVRHDGHEYIAASSLVIAALIVLFINFGKTIYSPKIMKSKRILIIVFIPIIACGFYIPQIFKNNIYINAFDGLRLRLADSNVLQSKFDNKLNEIRKEYNISALLGTTDIYSCDQAYLLASNNKWNPRPIIQSYAVFTPSLAYVNEQHLRTIKAPDNILFRVQQIDGRLPTLEDGLSWPALFDNYIVGNLDKDFAYLSKKPTIQSKSKFAVLYEGTQTLGELVALPASNNPVFAEIDIKPTFLGRIMGMLFKPPQLKMKINCQDSSTREYRVPSNMMQSGFFISPLVNNTKEFALLATGNSSSLRGNSVESVEITSQYGKSLFWSNTYTIKLKEYHYPNQATTAIPVKFSNSMFNSLPDGYVEAMSVDSSDGFIDLVNGISPLAQKIKTSGVLSVDGWLAVSAKDGLAPDNVYVTLKDLNEKVIYYISTWRVSRNDVKAHFKKPEMPDVGYTAIADVSGLHGEYWLGLAMGYNGKLFQCKQFNIPILIE